MRAIIFTIAYKPYIGGAEIALEEMVKRMPDISFDIVTPRYSSTLPAREIIENVTIHRIGWTTKKPIKGMKLGFWVGLNKLFFPLTAFLKARKIQKEHSSIDFIWSIMANYAGFAALWFKYVNPKIPYILNLQEGDFENGAAKKVRFILPLFRKIFTKADHIHVLTHYLENWAREMGYRGAIDIIPNGVDVERFRQDIHCEAREKLRSRMIPDYKDDSRIIITTGRLVHKNGIDTLIEALHFLPHIMHLVILAEGPKEDEYRKIAESIPQDRVHFLGSVPNKDIQKYLKASDVFARPSRSEGQGISFIEAMAAGVPVVATPVGGIVDFLFDPRDVSYRATGLLAEPENSVSVAQKILMYEHDDLLRDLIIDNAEQLIKENYNWDNIAVEIYSIFRKVLNEQKN